MSIEIRVKVLLAILAESICEYIRSTTVFKLETNFKENYQAQLVFKFEVNLPFKFEINGVLSD